MDLKNKSILVIGGAGFIGSHVVQELRKTNVSKVIIYDNLTRGKLALPKESLKDPRCEIFPNCGDVREVDVLDAAV